MRAWRVVALALVLSTCTPEARAQDGPPARPLGEVLIAYANAARIDLIFDPALVAERATRLTVRGSAPPETELARLLRGTDLHVRRLPSGTFVLVPPGTAPHALARVSLRGRVVDARGRPVAGAHVIIGAEEGGTVTSRDGAFGLAPRPPGPYRLRVTHVGYRPHESAVRLAAGDTAEVVVTLRPGMITLSPLVAEDVRGRLRLRAASTVPRGLAAERPHGLGTVDAVRSLDALAGVRVGAVLADVYLQGSEAGEHQFRLDGVPVFEPVHLRGLIGAFNPFAIAGTTVHKAGYGVEHGSQLAGVITAEHLLPTHDDARVDAQLDPLSLNVLASAGTSRPGGLSAHGMVALRTSLWSVYPDAVAAPQRRLLRDWNTPDPFLLNASVIGLLSAFDDVFGGDLLARVDTTHRYGFDPGLGFRDLHAAGVVRLRDGGEVRASVYNGANHLSGNQVAVRTARSGADADPDPPAALRDRYAWSNTTAQVSHRRLLSSRALLTTRLRGSRYDLGHDYSGLEAGDSLGIPLPDGTPFSFRVVERVQPSDDGNRIGEGAAEGRLDLQLASRWTVQLGLDAAVTRHRFLIEDANLSFGEASFRRIREAGTSWRLAGFGEVRADVTRGTTVTAGLRTTHLPARGAVYAEPRLALRHERAGRTTGLSAELAAGLYRQFVNQFHVSSISPSALFPAVRFWLPVDASVAPPKAYHLAATVLWAAPGPLTVRGEAYLKEQVHQLVIDYTALWNRAPADSAGRQASFLRAGRGRAWGAALGADVDRPRWEAGVRGEYSHAHRTRTLGPARGTGVEPVPWNEPVRLDAHAAWRPSERVRLSLRWRSAWGRKWAFRQAYYDYIASDPQTTQKTFGPYDFLRPQDHRMRPLHQLDAAVAVEQPVGAARLRLRADLLNVLGRRNAADWTLDVREDEDGTLRYEHVPRPLLPRLPSVALRVIW